MKFKQFIKLIIKLLILKPTIFFISLLKYIIIRIVVKQKIKRYKDLLTKGNWVIRNEYAYLNHWSQNHIFDFAKSFIETKLGVWDTREYRIVERFLSLDRVSINHNIGQQHINSDFILVSRSGNLKFFDHLNQKVYTKATIREWERRKFILNKPIFEYIKTPDSKAIIHKKHFFIADALINAPVMGSYDSSLQKEIYSKVFRCYTNYIIDHRVKPKPELIQNSYYEIMQYIPKNILHEYLKMEAQIIDFSTRCYLIEAHLDFNIGNILFNESTDEIFLLDNDDLGLLMPSMFDVINLSFNEVYSARDLFLLNALHNKEMGMEFNSLLKAGLIDVKKSDYRVSLFVNFFMRESSYLSDALNIGKPHTNRLTIRWNSLSKYIIN